MIFFRSLKEALEAYHCNLSQDVPIIQEIRNEVRKLNTKNIIWEKITNLERDLRLTNAMERLIAPSMDQVNISQSISHTFPELRGGVNRI